MIFCVARWAIVAYRREWGSVSRPPVVPSWGVFRRSRSMPPLRCEFEKLLKSNAPSHMYARRYLVGSSGPGMVICAWFKFIRLSLALASLANALRQLPRREDSAWDPTPQQLTNYVLAPAAGTPDYLWNGSVDPASQLTREPPPPPPPTDYTRNTTRSIKPIGARNPKASSA